MSHTLRQTIDIYCAKCKKPLDADCYDDQHVIYIELCSNCSPQEEEEENIYPYHEEQY